jgi:hypothetical protein
MNPTFIEENTRIWMVSTLPVMAILLLWGKLSVGLLIVLVNELNGYSQSNFK